MFLVLGSWLRCDAAFCVAAAVTRWWAAGGEAGEEPRRHRRGYGEKVEGGGWKGMEQGEKSTDW